MPILMLTGHDSDAGTILGLDAARTTISPNVQVPGAAGTAAPQLRTHEQSEDAIFSSLVYTFKPAMKMLVDARDRRSA